MVPLLVYVLLCLAGVTQSSIGADVLRVQPDQVNGFELGTPQTVRSDEFITSTPTYLGVTATGSSDTLNPLAAQQGVFSGLPRGPVSGVVLLDSAALSLGPWLPDAMLMAAKWWLPFLLLLLAAPAWFRRMTGSTRIGWWAAALVIASPSSAWWSFIHVQILGFGMASLVALQCAVAAVHRRRWPVAAGWVLAGAVLLTRTAFAYQPWVVVLIPPLLLVTIVQLLGPRATRRAAAATIGVAGVAGIVVLAAVLVENRAEISVLTSTVYPGQRRATGTPNPLQQILGATALSSLGGGAAVAGSNASEISSSFAVLWAWVVVLAATGLRFADRSQRVVLAVFAAVSSFWVAWSTISFGALGSHLPVVSLVPSERAAEVLGYLAVLMTCLVLPRLRDRPGPAVAVLSGGVVAVLAAYAASALRMDDVPSLSLSGVWVSSLLVGVVVAVVTWWPRRRVGYVLGVVGALALVWNVNPVLVGSADLRDTAPADYMVAAGREARADGTYFVSDGYAVDALMLATGVPSVSGRQVSGPDAKAWHSFVPREPEDVWNRGAAFIWFQWTADRRLVFTNPGPDVILISGSPCDVARLIPAVTHVVANHELPYGCLRQVHEFSWGGAPQWVYDVER